MSSSCCYFFQLKMNSLLHRCTCAGGRDRAKKICKNSMALGFQTSDLVMFCLFLSTWCLFRHFLLFLVLFDLKKKNQTPKKNFKINAKQIFSVILFLWKFFCGVLMVGHLLTSNLAPAVRKKFEYFGYIIPPPSNYLNPSPLFLFHIKM